MSTDFPAWYQAELNFKDEVPTSSQTIAKPNVGSSVDVPPVRVRFYPTDTDETFDGTVIYEKPNFFVVIPDKNLMLTQNWNKEKCDVLR